MDNGNDPISCKNGLVIEDKNAEDSAPSSTSDASVGSTSIDKFELETLDPRVTY